jgi:hypothetical protein
VRQKLLVLCLANPDLDSRVVAWSSYDGTGQTYAMAGDADEPPYASVLAAMRDGWRVLQFPPLAPPAPALEHRTGFLRFEYVLEKLVPTGETSETTQTDQTAQATISGQMGARGTR